MSSNTDKQIPSLRFRYTALPLLYWAPAIVISALAVAFSIVRAIGPWFDFDTTIDTTTVALFGVALLPFLIPLVRSLEVSSTSIKAELNIGEVKQEVAKKEDVTEDELQRRQNEFLRSLTETFSPDISKVIETADMSKVIETAIELGRLRGLSESLDVAAEAYSPISGTIAPTPFTDYLMRELDHPQVRDLPPISTPHVSGAADVNDPRNYPR